MALSVREVDPRTECDQLSRLVQEFVNPQADRARFDWLYLKCPAGYARTWVLEEADKPVGISAAFPRTIRKGAERCAAWLLGDFGIAPSHRALGPALQLQRATLASLGKDPVIDWPSRSMVGVYRRMGHSTFLRYTRYIRPVSGERVTKRVPEVVRPLASGVATAVLRARDFSPMRAWAVAQQRGTDFNALAELANRTSSACAEVERTAEFLRWRYREHPSQNFEVLTAQKNGSTGAYLVYTREGQEAFIAELRATNREAFKDLIQECSDIVRRQGCTGLHASFPEGDDRAGLLESAGFHARESSDLVLMHGDSLMPLRLDDGDRES